MMEKLKRFKRRMKNYGDDHHEMYETLQHGRSEEIDLLGPKERLMMEQVREGDTEELKRHLEVISTLFCEPDCNNPQVHVYEPAGLCSNC